MNNGTIMETFTGRKFSLLQPQARAVCIEDIAHHLSQIARWNGAARIRVSVAEHSIWVSDWLAWMCRPSHVVLLGLLHDAAEAYIGDNHSPKKIAVPQLKTIEAAIEYVIWDALDVRPPTAEESRKVKQGDRAVTSLEARQFMRSRGDWMGLPCVPQRQLPRIADPEGRFLDRYWTLRNGQAQDDRSHTRSPAQARA